MNLLCEGIFDNEGTKLDPCDDYSTAETCPPVVRLETGARNIIPLKTLLRASGIE